LAAKLTTEVAEHQVRNHKPKQRAENLCADPCRGVAALSASIVYEHLVGTIAQRAGDGAAALIVGTVHTSEVVDA
jgi:hypothetical protein